MVQEELNPGLKVGGVLLTMFDARANLAHQVVDEVRSFFGDQCLGRSPPRNVRLSEDPGFRSSRCAVCAETPVRKPASRGRSAVGRRGAGRGLSAFDLDR